jgi:hypothetical protein
MMDAQTLSDRIEIDDLLTRYSFAIDAHDWDRLDEVFTPDAHIDYTATGGIAGPFPEVKKWLAEMLPMFSAMQHAITQKQVVIDGDSAQVRAYFLNPMQIAQQDGSTWQMDIGGAYVHSLVRTPEGWRSERLHEEMLWQRKD